MRQLYEAYRGNKKISPLVRQLPWTHHLINFGQAKLPEERLFYIGVLLCATKDDEVVEYALARTTSPSLVAEYQTMLPPKAVLRQRLHELYVLLAPEETEVEIRHLERDEREQAPAARARRQKPGRKRQGR